MKCNSLYFLQILIIFSIIQFGNSQKLPKQFKRSQNATDNCPEMAEWESLHPKESFYITFPAEYVVVHHTMGPRCFNSKICKRIIENIQIYSMNVMTLPDIKYNFLLGEDGKIYQGTGWFRKGFHTSDDINSKSISIAFLGDFIDALPLNIAIENLRSLLKCGKLSGYLAKNYKLVAAFQLEKSIKGPGKFLFYELQSFEHFFNDQNETM